MVGGLGGGSLLCSGCGIGSLLAESGEDSSAAAAAAGGGACGAVGGGRGLGFEGGRARRCRRGFRHCLGDGLRQGKGCSEEVVGRLGGAAQVVPVSKILKQDAAFRAIVGR